MRSLGDVFVTEAKNAKKLQKRANPEDPLNKNGKPNERNALAVPSRTAAQDIFRQRYSNCLNRPAGPISKFHRITGLVSMTIP